MKAYLEVGWAEPLGLCPLNPSPTPDMFPPTSTPNLLQAENLTVQQELTP